MSCIRLHRPISLSIEPGRRLTEIEATHSEVINEHRTYGSVSSQRATGLVQSRLPIQHTRALLLTTKLTSLVY